METSREFNRSSSSSSGTDTTHGTTRGDHSKSHWGNTGVSVFQHGTVDSTGFGNSLGIRTGAQAAQSLNLTGPQAVPSLNLTTAPENDAKENSEAEINDINPFSLSTQSYLLSSLAVPVDQRHGFVRLNEKLPSAGKIIKIELAGDIYVATVLKVNISTIFEYY